MNSGCHTGRGDRPVAPTNGMNPRAFIGRAWPAVLCLLLTHPPTLTAQTGYRLTRDQVVIDQAAHWAEWEAPIGTHVITAEGAVLPRFLRRDINAALNAMEFETPEAGGDTLVGGIRRAGSSAAQAPFIMDGDQGTYWEPDPTDPLKDWFVDVELGRSVIAKRVVVRFAEEGDPFLKFRVLLSDGRGHPERPLKFFRVGQVTYPNKTEREFSFEVRPQRPLPAGVEGEVAQIVRFQALASDSTRGAEVDRATYEALSPADQGTVEYFRQTVIGRQILIDEQTHRELPEEERGQVRYFRRERPRLAELEVYTLGDNVVTLTQRLRNRNVSIFENILLALATDGLFRSFYPLRIYDSVLDRNQLIVDLGARFWLDRVRLVSCRGAFKRLSAPDLGWQFRPRWLAVVGNFGGAAESGVLSAARRAVPHAGGALFGTEASSASVSRRAYRDGQLERDPGLWRRLRVQGRARIARYPPRPLADLLRGGMGRRPAPGYPARDPHSQRRRSD